MKEKWVRGVFSLALIIIAVLCASRTDAAIFISEVLADPPSGIIGDANGDGSTSSSKDEFVELFNSGTEATDFSGWSLFDQVKMRHVFDQGFILNPYSYAVVFGSSASSGSLSLNNRGDVLKLFDANGILVDQMAYGKEGGKDQSLVRINENGIIEYVFHSTAPEAEGRLFSPGTDVTGGIPVIVEMPDELPTTATPEPGTAFLVGMGILIFGVLKRNAVLDYLLQRHVLNNVL